MTVRRAAAFTILVLGVGTLALADTAAAQSSRGEARTQAQRTATTRNAPRARTRIRVAPVYPYRLEALPYPTLYPHEYLGPNAVRQCTAQLVKEYRASGTVIVPTTRCWWERG
jgi:hypothetical protein